MSGIKYRVNTHHAIAWARKVHVRRSKKQLPTLQKLIQQTAEYHKVSLAEVSPNMAKAFLRHQFTNYEMLMREWKSRESSARYSINDVSEARRILKRKAMRLTERLYQKLTWLRLS